MSDEKASGGAAMQSIAAPRAQGRARADRPLRIGFLSYRSHPRSGGQGVYVRHVTKALADEGHQVDVISGPPYPELDARVRLIPLPSLNLYDAPNAFLALHRRNLHSLADLAEWAIHNAGGFGEPYAFGRRAFAYLRERLGSYDVLHDNQTLAPGMLRLQKAGARLVTTIHHPISVDRRLALEAASTPTARLGTRRWYRFVGMQARVARRLERIVVVSASTKADVVRDFGVRPERMSVVYNGIDTEVFRPLADTERRAHRIVATASADVPLKGLTVLLHAFAHLRAKHPQADLVIIGAMREGSGTETLVRTLGLGDKVRFTGSVGPDEIVRCYSEAAVAVVPSLYEGFGLPAGEAMACGVPVVSTTGGALPEVVGNAGLLVPPGDPEMLAAALSALLKDPARRALLGAQGRSRILRSFTWAGAARALTGLYRTMGADVDR